MKAIYFMPILVGQYADAVGDRELQKFGSFFYLLNKNACIIDRVGALETPFETLSLYPIPEANDFSNLTFTDVCFNRARELLQFGEKIQLTFSGGLDSTTVLMSFIVAIQEGYGSFDQVEVLATPHSIIENPVAWSTYVLPNFKIKSMAAHMDAPIPEDVRVVSGENGDQLFGSDIILSNLDMFDKAITSDEIRAFVVSRKVPPHAIDDVHARLSKLISKCPVQLNTMADAIWWLNFSSKWQSVCFRVLAFSNNIKSGDDLSSFERFRSFFNTPEFQWMSLHGGVKKWGSPPALNNYKLAMRETLSQFEPLADYVRTKIKVPSLYRVFPTTGNYHAVIAVDGNNKIQLLKTIGELNDSPN